MTNTYNPPLDKIPGNRAKDARSPKLIQGFWNRFFKYHPLDFERFGKEALNWFRINVSKTTSVKAETIIRGHEDYTAIAASNSKSRIGKLYLYKYKAETAGDEKTGLYDMYPMVFIFNVSKTKTNKLLVHALNMHYLYPKQRYILYLELIKLKTSKTFSEKTKLRLQWQAIKAASSSKLFEKAVHTYRLDRFQSQMIEIPAYDWPVAVFLQIQKWHKIGSSDTLQSYAKLLRKNATKKPKKI